MAEKKQPKIHLFFSKPIPGTSSPHQLSSSDSHSPDLPSTITSSIPLSSSDPIITEPTLNDTKITDIFDIACYTNKLLSQNEKADILNKIWKPDLNYNFPVKTSVVELYEFVEEALEDISMWNDNDTSDKARRLRSCKLNVEFILSLIILNKGFALGLALSKCIQTTSIDLKEAMFLAKNTKQELEEIRANADTYFREMFEQVKLMTTQFDIEIKIPRTAKRQTNRCSIEVDNAETYYRISIFIPYLDKYINELENRFTNHHTTLSKKMWSIVLFNFDNSVAAVPSHWYKNGQCAWPKKYIKNKNKYIERRTATNALEFDFYSARKLNTEKAIDSFKEAKEKARRAQITSDLSSADEQPKRSLGSAKKKYLPPPTFSENW
ncbi:hypothetical protein ACI65C_006818 [Semiaphis heraclei]